MIRSPRRRLTAIAVMGALAVVALAGCRTDAGSAAYVGNTRITTDQVNDVIDSAPQLSADLTGARQEVVNDLVYLAAVQKFAAANKIKLTPVDDATREQYAQAYQVPNDAAHRKFIDFEASVSNWTQDLLKAQPGSTPSDADLMRLFNELKADFPEGTTFDQAKPTLLNVPNVRQGIELRNGLEKAFQDYDISISPMYTAKCTKAPCAAPTVPLVSVQGQDGRPITVVSLPLTEGNASPAVVDLPSAVASAPAQS